MARDRERTVGFYEIVLDDHAGNTRFDHAPWDEFMARVASSPITETTFEGEATLIGTSHTYGAKDNLLLHRVKDAGEWLARLDRSAGRVEEVSLESDAVDGYLETTAICFLSFGNVVGLMQGSTAAPTHNALETWLNGLEALEGKRVIVRPVIAQAEIERLKGAAGASRFEIKIGQSKAAALDNKQRRLARFLKTAREDYGDVDLTLIISIPRGKSNDGSREELLEDLKELQDVLPGVERARARLTYAEKGTAEHKRLVELVEHHVTAKKHVPVVDAEGNVVRISSAVQVIMDVAAQHEDELRRIVEATVQN